MKTLKFELLGVNFFFRIDTRFSIRKYRHWAIVSHYPDIGVVGVTTDPIGPGWEASGYRLVPITKHQFETHGEDPGQWTQLT